MSSFDNIQPTDLAVVGMSCRFPDADTPAQFWANVSRGFESVRSFSESELLSAGEDAARLSDPHYIRKGVVLEGLDQFDAGFVGFSAREAAIMDPQHRIFLECVWEAIENCGHTPESFPGLIGVFAGCGMNAYLMYNLLTNRSLMDSTGMFLVRHTGNDKDFLSTRASYQFNLRGPSVGVQTACSTSLVAIHMAGQSLLSGECDLALAGGVTIEVPHRHGYQYLEGEILSKDGHCRPFDAESSGTIFGSGCGVVALRRLSDAVESGDSIYAILKGTAINNDGSSKVGYLAPSVDGQAKAMTEALAVAGVEASSIGYVETHGTGTAVGDPIEITALTQAFGRTASAKQFCAIGSVKSNIGHLDTAAGVASFIKTVQALRHRQLPPSLNYKTPNPLIDFAATPFFVNTELRSWPAGNGPRRASVNSLGVGGTNAHVVLEEAPEVGAAPSAHPMHLVTLSARSAEALDAATDRFAQHFEALPEDRFADTSFTAQVGRKRFRHRRFVVAPTAAEAAAALRAKDPKRVITAASDASGLRPVFMFPGGGAQYPNMGRELYERLPVFRRHAGECLALLPPEIGATLKSWMFPEPARIDEAAASLARPLYSILSVFVVEYALAQQLFAWGVVPAAMTGHSLGEYTAACLSGVISLSDAIALVLARGQIFERMPAGSMLSVALPEAELRSSLGPALSIAAVNGPSAIVVSGESAAIEGLEQELRAKEIECARLHISVAAHSPMLDPFLDEFATLCARIELKAPRIPYISNLTGAWLRTADLDARYWVRHLRNTVRFSEGLSALLQEPNRILVEAGPGTGLSSLARQHPDKKPGHTAIACMRHPKEEVPDLNVLYGAIGRIWAAGGEIDWKAFWEGEKRTRIAIPTYPFERKRYWIDPGKVAHSDALTLSPPEPEPPAAPAIAKQPNMDSWFWKPVWEPSALTEAPAPTKSSWLVLCDAGGLGAALAKQLHRAGHTVTSVSMGAHFSAESESEYTLFPGDAAQWSSLIASLSDSDRIPKRIVYAWACGGGLPDKPLASRLEEEVDLCLWAPVGLLQALAREDLADGLDFTFVTDGAKSVLAGESISRPERALLAGPAKVFPNEFPGVVTRWVDLDSGMSSKDRETIASALLREVTAGSEPGLCIAYRGGARLVERWVPEPSPSVASAPSPLAISAPFLNGATYVITGGLGGMALTFARHLASHHKARIALVHRSALPPRAKWSELLANQPASRAGRQVRELLQIEALGGEIHAYQGDVADPAGFGRVLRSIGDSLGPIHGIFHTAGVMQDGALIEKTRQEAMTVLGPKVAGTLAIDAAIEEGKPAFVLLCSSTSALLGLAGQVDYVAANAFLDAYAHSRRTGTTRVVSLNWGIWSGVGMAVKSSGGDSSSQSLASLVLQPSVNWLLNEHKLRQGPYVLPGTAYVDLAISAVRQLRPEGPIELRNLHFLAPMVFHNPEDRRDANVDTAGSQGALTIEISSSADGAGQAVVHAQAEWLDSTPPPQPRFDLTGAKARCGLREIDATAGERWTRQGDFLDFGRRWSNVRHIWAGERELVAEFALAPEFAADLADHPAHPALLDMATSAGIALAADALTCGDLYVPLSYRRIAVYAPLPSNVFSYVRLRHQEKGDHGVAVFDVLILAPDGTTLMDIEEFTMRRIPPESLTVSGSVSGAQAPRQDAASRGNGGQQSRLQEWIAAGITPDEGISVLTRVLSNPSLVQVAATSIDLGNLFQLARPRTRRYESTSDVQAGESADKIEASLQRFWGELLGLDAAGLDEDFFELGGHSLLAVRLFVKIRKAYNLDLGLTTLFEARTIRQLAAVIRRGLGDEDGAKKEFSCLVPLRKAGSRPIHFCLHGVGGNVLGYNELAKRLPADQPFYAIQSRGLSRQAPPSTDMREIAAGYVRELLEIQPEGPYYLSGYSFGGVAAYEMAIQLQAMGHRVAFLGLLDTDRPNATIDLKTRIQLNIQHILRLPAPERKKYLARKWENITSRFRKQPEPVAAAPTPAESPTKSFQDVRNANFVAYHAYYAPEYHGPIALFRASELGDSGFRKPGLGWFDVGRGGVEEHWVPGNHMTILYEPCVSVLAEKLTACLERVYEREGVLNTPKAASGGEISRGHAEAIALKSSS